ncbi:HAMP domain-containing histidine kinase [Halobacillus locisalis]|uniref:histidine kinase n=1 Tax=Halobacillus locisalis TaxID=220753 RepID=A0A838CU54_9BACI|nr:HAMP domain-containing sensor histidine kinase [Halobacillus locisalis]MBA2175672.1 HAMP domain-containing histidine kinase [Halobacillus locisalis]
MSKRISLKIGMLFFILMIIIELSLFFVLYTNISSYQIEEVLDGLLTRGGSHRDVLEKKFDQTTLTHVDLMESETVTDVVVTDEDGTVLSNSSSTDPSQRELLKEYPVSSEQSGMIIEDQWKTSPYVATISPIIIGGELKGNVYMFSPSTIIRDLTSHLTKQFLIVMLLTIILTLIVVFTLSRLVTKPLVRMKEETEKLSRGETNLELHDHYNDELGVLARSINRLAEELERIKQERNDFLSSIAHELRTPLTYLKGYADIAAREETTHAERIKHLKIIKEESESLSGMVQHLFQLAKMDENTFNIQPRVCDVRLLLEQLKEKMYPLISSYSGRVNVECPEELTVYADPTRFTQVMVILVDNALRYSGLSPSVSIHAEPSNSQVILKIKDEGPGVPEESIPYLFDRLYRTDKSRSRNSGGSGLGLAIAKEIIEMHGGEIEAYNQSGLTIQILWPRDGSL